jgi:hypothetical protein
VRETIGLLRRTLARLDVSSRSMFALIEPGSCFAGTLARARACRRPRLHAGAARRAGAAPTLQLDESTSGLLPMVSGSRASARASTESRRPAGLRQRDGLPPPLTPRSLGLVTAAPDDIDWDDEIRIAIEERAACRPTRSRPRGQPPLRGTRTMARASSAASPPGRTGSSSAPTPWATRARSRSTAPAKSRLRLQARLTDAPG